jgi:choline dehydrogenase-like flavoprotein
MLSGIGPRNACESIGVTPIKELPAVGATLSDHYAIPIMLEVPKKETLRILESLWGLWQIIIWIFFRRGLISISSTTSAIFLQTKSIDERTMKVKTSNVDAANDVNESSRYDVPDIEITIIPLATLERDVPGHSLFSLYPSIVQPRGSGRIELADRDPSSNPRITHPMFLDEQDVVVARRAIRFTMRLAEEFQNSGYPYPAPLAFAPGNRPDLLAEWEKSGGTKGTNQATVGLHAPAVAIKQTTTHMAPTDGKTWRTVTDEEIDDYMRRVTHTALHFSCTCPMSNSEETGVVDQQLRVFGFKNLRIADASVFPSIPSGHTMAPVMMVAERCADFVKDTWKESGTAGD